MRLINVLPVSLRIAMLYTKAAKICKTDKSNSEKLDLIKQKEAFWFESSTFKVEKLSNEQAIAVSIGLKDIAKIYNSLNAPDDALRCLSLINGVFEKNLDRLRQENTNHQKIQSVYENQIWAWLHTATSYAKKNQIDLCVSYLDRINKSLNAEIESQPANRRLSDFYTYTISQTFDLLVAIADVFPESQQKAYNACFSILKEFDKRDPGNEKIVEYINRFS